MPRNTDTELVFEIEMPLYKAAKLHASAVGMTVEELIAALLIREYWRMMERTQQSVALLPEFVAVADRFGMVPVKLAERVLASFVKDRPRQLTISASKRRLA